MTDVKHQLLGGPGLHSWEQVWCLATRISSSTWRMRQFLLWRHLTSNTWRETPNGSGPFSACSSAFWQGYYLFLELVSSCLMTSHHQSSTPTWIPIPIWCPQFWRSEVLRKDALATDVLFPSNLPRSRLWSHQKGGWSLFEVSWRDRPAVLCSKNGWPPNQTMLSTIQSW